MGMKISELDFMRLLPVFMQEDEAVIALSKAINELFVEPGKRLDTIRIWDRIDELSEEECDELAWELDVDWYNANMTLAEKRETLKVARRIKRKRGTKWAVEELVNAAFGYGKVTEWFENGDSPFYFTILTNATLTEDGMKYFISMIDKAKNVRSRLRSIKIQRTNYNTINIGAVHKMAMKNVIIDTFDLKQKIQMQQYNGIAPGVYQIKTIIKEE